MTDDFSYDSRVPRPKRVNKLTNSRVTEISLVPDGMNTHARLLFSKSFDGGEPGGAMPDLILKSAGGALTEADLLIAVTTGDATVAEICKALEAGTITYRVSSDPEIVQKVWDAYGDHRPANVRTVAGARIFAKALATPLRPNEKLRGFVARIGKSRVLYPIDRLVIEAAYTLHKRKAAVSKRHTAEFAKGVDTLESIAKQLQIADPRLSYQQAFAKATATGDGARLFRKLQETRSHALATVQDAMFKGRVAAGPGFDTAATSPDNSGDGAGDDGEGAEHWSPEEMAEAYAATSADAEAEDGIYSGERSYEGDGGADANTDFKNVGDADGSTGRIARRAEELRKASGFKMSAATAFTKACEQLPADYLKAAAAGKFRR